MTSQPPSGGWPQGPQPQQPMWQSQYGPKQPYPPAPQQQFHRTSRPAADWIRFGVGATAILCGLLTLLSLMLSMVTFHVSDPSGEGLELNGSLQPFKELDLGILTAAISENEEAKKALGPASSLATFTGIMSLLAALLFIAAGVLLVLRHNVLLTTGMAVGALYLCAAARIPAGIITGLVDRVTSAWSQLSNQFDTSSDIGKAWSLLPTAAIKNGAGTNLIIASEIIGGIALIVLVAWVITCGVKTMKGAIR